MKAKHLVLTFCFGLVSAAICTIHAQTVIFSKPLGGGKILEVIRESSPYTLRDAGARFKATNFNGAIHAIYSEGPAKPDPNTMDTFYAVIQNGTNRVPFRDRAITIAHRNLDPDVVIVDVSHESAATVFLYRGRFTPTAVKEMPLRVEMIIPTKKGGPVQVGKLLWRPSEGMYSRVENARISGSYEQGTLAVELTWTLDKLKMAQTNRFINGEWTVSKGVPTPVQKGGFPPQ